MTIKLSEKHQDQIKEFAEKAIVVYEGMNWSWGDETITVAGIVEKATHCVKTLLEDPKCHYSSTGGIMVERTDEDLLEISMSVNFATTYLEL